jgi:hypothetical protein
MKRSWVDDEMGLPTDDCAKRLAVDLAAETPAQIEVAGVVLKSLIFAADLAVFAICHWHFKLGLLLSIGAAVVVHFALLIGIVLPVGYVLGKRSAQRLKTLRPDASPDMTIRAASLVNRKGRIP